MQNMEVTSRRRMVGLRPSARQVFYADGEKRSTHTIRAILDQFDVEVTTFDSAAACLNCLEARRCHLLISNARQPRIEGMELLLGARRIKPLVPVVLLVDHGEVEVAVRAMKAGAADCLERPPDTGPLVSTIEAALKECAPSQLLPKRPLSPVEERVLGFILQGCTTNEMARKLCRSRRTIEVHRSHIMEKLDADGIVDLVKRCARLGLLRDWSADPAASEKCMIDTSEVNLPA
jgi:FixJ family two-component response regulator